MRATEKKALALALGVGYGVSIPAYADLIVLRSGDKLEGAVTGQTISTVNFVGDEGDVRMIPKSTIASIFYFSRTESQKQDIKLVALKKEEQKKEREEKLKKKREEDRKRREKELREKREQERIEAATDQELENGRENLSEAELQALEEQSQRNAENAARERARLELTRGTVRLWSGQEIKAQITEKHGQRYVLETSAGFMEFHASEIEQMEIPASADGSRPARIVEASELEAVKTIRTAKDEMDLSGGSTVAFQKSSFDGYNTELESDLGKIQLRPDDADFSQKSSRGMDLLVGQYGYVMLRSGLQIHGDLVLRSNYEWVLRTDKGEIHFDPDDIVFARQDVRKEDGFLSTLTFWR